MCVVGKIGVHQGNPILGGFRFECLADGISIAEVLCGHRLADGNRQRIDQRGCWIAVNDVVREHLEEVFIAQHDIVPIERVVAVA